MLVPLTRRREVFLSILESIEFRNAGQSRHFSSSSGLVAKWKPVVKGVVSEALKVPEHIQRPPYVANGGADPLSGRFLSTFDVHGDDLKNMRTACKHARDILNYAGELVKPGVTTDYIDRRVHEFTVSQGVYPSPLGYRGFPKSLCSSVNDVLCHGIPDDRELVEGDIVNLDVSCYSKGHHGDNSRTFTVGKVDAEAQKLVDVTESCLAECIQSCGPGVPLRKIGEIVGRICAENGYDPCRDFCGHGIGDTMHMLPYVLHFPNDDPLVLREGMVFTIEPILCQGKQDHFVWNDGWTIASIDGLPSAQAEHVILITANGAEILT